MATKKNTKRQGNTKRELMPTKVPCKKLVIPRPNILHSYLDHKQVMQYLDYVANRYSHFVKLHHLGNSYEQRELRAIEINWMNSGNVELPIHMRMQSTPITAITAITATTRPSQALTGKEPYLVPDNREQNIVFIEAGTHAREWITITTALNCIYQLTERYTRNVEILRKLRFFIIPLVNPDGYEYSRIKNRQWRKNRRPHKTTKYVGTDCNRNYDIYWESAPSKTYRNTYKGEKPFSEPETRAIRGILNKLKSNLLFFLSLHSCGQSIMYPWGYSRDAPEYWYQLHQLATSGRNAIKSYNGREYRTGSISTITKRTIAGSVVDYVYGILKIPMALVMELPSPDLGFQPPVEMISQIGHESWFGIREMCKCAYDLRSQIDRQTETGLPEPPLANNIQRATAGQAKLTKKLPNHSEQKLVIQNDKDSVILSKQVKHKKFKRRTKKHKATKTPNAALRGTQKHNAVAVNTIVKNKAHVASTSVVLKVQNKVATRAGDGLA